MTEQKVLAGIDIGCSGVKCVAALERPDSVPEIVGVGITPCSGHIRQGVLINAPCKVSKKLFPQINGDLERLFIPEFQRIQCPHCSQGNQVYPMGPVQKGVSRWMVPISDVMRRCQFGSWDDLVASSTEQWLRLPAFRLDGKTGT